MRIAILIQCHKNPKQINLLLERLNHPDIDCYLHIDKKADFADKIIHRENVFVLPDEQRVFGGMGTDFAGYGNAKSSEYSCCLYKGRL